MLAERHGLRIHEVPVDWVEDPDSRVKHRQHRLGDLKGIRRLRREPGRRHRARPAAPRQPALAGGGPTR